MDNETNQGYLAEQWVAREYGLQQAGESEAWYDLIDPDHGHKYQVKSTRSQLANGRSGRFRIWETDHRSISISAGSRPAYYVFVLYDSRGSRVLKHRRCYPSTVTKLVAGRWNNADHHLKDSRQYKLSIKSVFG